MQNKPLTPSEKQIVQDESDAEKAYQKTVHQHSVREPQIPEKDPHYNQGMRESEPAKDPVPPVPLAPADATPNVLEQIAVVLKDSGADTMQQVKALEKIKAILCL